MNFDQEFNDHFALWRLENHSPFWPLYESPEASRLVREKAINKGGQISISHFILSFDELRNSGVLKQLRQPKPVETEDPGELTAEQFKSLPSAVVQRRFKSDIEFRTQVENLIARGQI